MKKYSLYLLVAFAASGVTVVMLALAFAYVPQANRSALRGASGPRTGIVALAANAFGSLADVSGVSGGTARATTLDAASGAGGGTAPTAAPSAGMSETAEMAQPMATEVKRVSAGVGGGGGIGAMPPYEAVRYRYVYRGESLQMPAERMDVYRRKTGGALAAAPQDVLRGAGLGLMDLGSFSSMSMQNISFVENRDNGYIVTTDFQNGMVSINENWERKTDDPYRCVNGRCPIVEPLTASEVPADDDLIRTANSFLAAHGVDVSLYGAPVVDHSWRMYATMDGGPVRTADAVSAEATSVSASDPVPSVMPIRAPDQISITYPYLIDGQEARSSSGDPIGMSVSVNLRGTRVAGAWGIAIQSFEKSSYATEQDTARILSFVERGGLYGYVDENAKTVDVELGDPTVILASFGRTVDDRWEELYVPSFAFPVLKKPADAPWLQNSIVVPLIKDLLVEPERPVPMPLIEQR